MPSFLERILLLPSALLAATLSHALAHGIQDLDTRSTTAPAPISIAPDGKWDGVDGSWSSFTLELGTPPQEIQTFISWSVYQTWAIVPQGCTNAVDYNACAQDRGGLYNETSSTTFDGKGTYDLWVGRTLGLYGNAIYGWDVVRLSGTNGPTLNHTIVGGTARETFYIGMFGVNPKPTNFSTFNDQSPSAMALLKDQDYIPSLSFGYTAGASYRSSFASLTLGGYDSSKFIKNDITWPFAPDNERDIVVALQDIFTPSKKASSPIAVKLLPSPIYVYLDALVPEIYLPIEACKAFEFEFGLTYDNTTELYLVNHTLHQSLLDRNASITFQLAIGLDSEESVNIELPYAAFDLTAKSPYAYLSTPTNYFPLKRAANESQYFIGRTFFQEAYISIDYERQRFNVSQRSWDESARTDIVAISALTSSSGSSSSGGNAGNKSSSLSGGAIAGIVVGAVAVIALLGILLMFLFRRRSQGPTREKIPSETGSAHDVSSGRRGQEATVFPKAELEGSVPSPLEQPALASGALSTQGSGSGQGTPQGAHHLSGSTYTSGPGISSSDSPTTGSPEDGTGTQSSTDTSTNTSRGTGTGTGNTAQSLVSPISPADARRRETPLYEMAGDAPTVKEKDGKALSEKEALAHREKVYNGVETPTEQPPTPVVNFSRASLQGPRRLNPEDVTTTDTLLNVPPEPRNYGRHRAFSFEEERLPEGESSKEELYES